MGAVSKQGGAGVIGTTYEIGDEIAFEDANRVAVGIVIVIILGEQGVFGFDALTQEGKRVYVPEEFVFEGRVDMKDRVRVTYSVTVEVSRSAWELTYGQGGTDTEVRQHVRGYLREQVQGCVPTDECDMVIIRDNSKDG